MLKTFKCSNTAFNMHIKRWKYVLSNTRYYKKKPEWWVFSLEQHIFIRYYYIITITLSFILFLFPALMLIKHVQYENKYYTILNQTVAYYAALVIALPKRKLPRTLKTCILETIMIHQNQSDWNANNFSKSCCSRTSHLNSVKPGTKN